jgi:hypothetical protein
MKLLNKCICLTSQKSVLIITVLLFSSFILASAWPDTTVIIPETKEEMWIPTEADIAYQDSMYTIIQNTQSDITDIKQDIVYIIERLDYEDGTHDSIRYAEGSQIDINRSKRN